MRRVAPASRAGRRPRRIASGARRNRRKPDLLALARNAALLLLGCQLVRAAFASPRLAVRMVQIAGAVRVAPARVVDLAGVPLGSNIFRINLPRLRQRVLLEPMLRDATVTRALPDGIRIEVRERTPRLLVASAGRFWEVDEDGIIFRERPTAPAPAERGDASSRQEEPDLPLLEILPAGAAWPPREGHPPMVGPARGPAAVQSEEKSANPTGSPPVVAAPGARLPASIWRAAHSCLNLAAGNRIPLQKIAFDGHGELWLNIAVSAPAKGERSLPVRLGRPTELGEKFAQLRWVLPSATADGEYLDLMCAGRAAYLKVGRRVETPQQPPAQVAASTGGTAARPDGTAAGEPVDAAERNSAE